MFQGLYPILKKENIAKEIYSYTILCPDIANIAKAGQFIHVKAEGFTLRRPISVCEIDKPAGTIRMVFEVRGEGTKEIAKLPQGGCIDILAPLGKGFSLLDPTLKVAVIGGGIGVPPMIEVAKHYKENATAIIGFQTSNKIILDQDFQNYGVKTMVCTDDGSKGIKGFVTVGLETLLKESSLDMIYVCGPLMMMKGIVDIANKHNIKCEVSMEQKMACGVGNCLVCVCKTKKNNQEKFAHVCIDGPVFKAEEVIF